MSQDPGFLRRERQNGPILSIFLLFMQENSFLRLPSPAFSTPSPGVTRVFKRSCGKLCGNCEKPLSPCGFPLSPVFTTPLCYVNKVSIFSKKEQKSPRLPIFCHPKIQKFSRNCPLYLVSRGFGEISFPQLVHRHLTYISQGGGRRGKSFPPQRKDYAFPRFCGILAAKQMVFQPVFTKRPLGRDKFHAFWGNGFLCTNFVEHTFWRFLP